MMQNFDGVLAVLGDTVFYISSYSANGRVFRSNDGGNSWTMYNSNLTNQSILSIAVLSEKTLYVGTEDGVFRSTNGGESWTKTNTGIINAYVENLVFFRDALYTVTGDGIVKSADEGNSWIAVNEGLVADDGATLTVSDGNLYAATNETNYRWNPSTSGLYRLADDGSSWVAIQRNMQSANDRIYGVNQLMVSGETFYVVGQMGDGARLYRWRVGEDLWTQFRSNDFFGWRPLAVSGRTVYVNPVGGKIFRSVDEGNSWTDVSRGLPKWEHQFAQDVYDLTCVGKMVYVRSDDGVFRSIDDGETWTSIDAGLRDSGIEMQLVDGTTLYGDKLSWDLPLDAGIGFMGANRSDTAQYHVTAYDGTTFYIGTNGRGGIYRFSLEE